VSGAVNKLLYLLYFEVESNIFLLLRQWNGILLKGEAREFAAKVIVKALKEGPNYKVIS
jgi:hypothetical protein